MHHPYQCLAICAPAQDPRTKFLLAASGHKLFSVSLDDGSIVFSWPTEEPKEVNVEVVEEHASKKRRLSNVHEDPPNIIDIAVTKNQRHAVVVTAEDKSIRVFEIAADGLLNHLSQRCMPKRPCAIKFTTDDSEILSADKFGDVYSLPLLPTPEQEDAFAASLKPATPKAFAPSATEQTVHSKANRRALEAQLKQAKEKQSVKTKEPLAFAHQLLLGHVSMLTDLLITTVMREEASERPRTYLLTSDRDEHIRISRGPPQAFVIEGYCLGHHEFVNKLCLAEPGLLVSGGGDDDLLVWDWLQTKLINKVDISKAVHRVKENLRRQEEGQQEAPKEDAREDTKVAVSGLWRLMSPSMGKSHLLIACEGVPALFHFPVSSLRHESGGEDVGYIPLIGNPLDITIVNNIIIISVDTIHEPGSTTNVDQSEDYKSRLHAFELVGEDLDGGAVWKGHVDLNQLFVDLNEQSTVEWHEKALQALLYGVENLRKRSGERDDQES